MIDNKPLDEHALITRLEMLERDALLDARRYRSIIKQATSDGEARAYGRVIRLIQEGRGVRK